MGSRPSGGPAGQRGPASTHKVQKPASGVITEVPLPGEVPRFELPGWRERYGVVAGITGRGTTEGGPGFDLGLWSNAPVGEVMNRWLGFRRAMGFGATVLGNQVHGVKLMRIDSGTGWIQVEGIDGWLSTTPGILLTITVADCVPVYLVLPGKAVALLHAGWRGTAGGILGRGIERLTTAVRVDAAELVMHCGVGICGECYEVGSEVMTGCGAPADGPGPWQLDLRCRLMDQARALGITQVTSSGWCSAHHRSHFYSHRASGGADGRMVAYLGLAATRLLPSDFPDNI